MTYSAVIIDTRPEIEPIIAQHEQFIPQGWEVRWVNNEPTETEQGYNKLLISKRFWRNMTDKVLIFQHDSMLIRNGVEQFTEWDFIGAPIKWLPGYMNGGLSIRSRSAMLRVIDNTEWNGSQNEDLYFIDGLRQLNSYLPDVETAMKFSVETMFYDKPIGYHCMDKYLTQEQCQSIRNLV